VGTKSTRSSGTQHNMRGVAQGNTLVDPITGLPVDVLLDSEGVRRLAVDTSIQLDGITVNVDPLTPLVDGVHIGDGEGDLLEINPDGSINVNTAVDAADGDNIAISGHASPVFDEAADTITTASYEEVYSYVAAAITNIEKIETTVDTTATFRVKLNGVVIKVLRSSPLEKNVVFTFKEHRVLADTDEISVEARVDRFKRTSYDTFVSLEGYLV